MKVRFLVASMMLALVALACGNTPKKSEAVAATPLVEEATLPEGAIPFIYDRHLLFDVVIRDSVKARMIFDAGSTNLVLDKAFYDERFAASGTLRRSMVQGAGNSVEASWIDMGGWSYQVGAHKMQEQVALVLELRKIVGDKADGMFGMEFMKGRRVAFNYHEGYIHILPDDFPTDGYIKIKCKWLDNSQVRMLVPMAVEVVEDVVVSGDYMIDTGFPGSVELCSHVAIGSALSSAEKRTHKVGGVGGSSEEYLFTAPRVEIAGFELNNVASSQSANTGGAMADARYEGIVGNALLEQFDVVFDFAACELWLKPNKNFNTEKQ